MPADDKKRKLWALMGIFFFIALNYPFLQIFNLDRLLGGIPVLVLYLHVVWILALVGLYVLARRSTSWE